MINLSFHFHSSLVLTHWTFLCFPTGHILICRSKRETKDHPAWSVKRPQLEPRRPWRPSLAPRWAPGHLFLLPPFRILWVHIDYHYDFVREACKKDPPQMTDQEIETSWGYVSCARKQVIAGRTRIDTSILACILHFPGLSQEGHASVHRCVRDCLVRFVTGGPEERWDVGALRSREKNQHYRGRVSAKDWTKIGGVDVWKLAKVCDCKVPLLQKD